MFIVGEVVFEATPFSSAKAVEHAAASGRTKLCIYVVFLVAEA